MLLLHDARLVCSVLCGTKVRNILTLFMKLAAHYVLCCSDLGLIGCLLLLAMLLRGGGGGRGGEGGQHDARADRVCTHCSHIATADALHIILRCPVLKPLQHCHAAAFS